MEANGVGMELPNGEGLELGQAPPLEAGGALGDGAGQEDGGGVLAPHGAVPAQAGAAAGGAVWDDGAGVEAGEGLFAPDGAVPAQAAAAAGGAGVEVGGGLFAPDGGVPAQAAAAAGGAGMEAEGGLFAPDGAVPSQAAAAGGVSIDDQALFLALLCLPAQEIARCRAVCRQWRDIVDTDAFRGDHRQHHNRRPMPLFFLTDPEFERVNLRAVDIRNGVSRPVFRFTRPVPDEVHQPLRIHGSCRGILLVSFGDRLYACNPCTRRWAHLDPPLHVDHDIIGFYVTGDFQCHVLYHDRQDFNCNYGVLTLGTDPRSIGRPGTDEEDLGLDALLADGIVPSYRIPPVLIQSFLHWLPQAVLDNEYVIRFDTSSDKFALIPPPTIRLNGEDVPVVGGQLFEIEEQLAMTVISPARVDVWLRNNQLWDRRYRIHLPVDVIDFNDGYHHDGTLTAGVFAVAQNRTVLVQCPHVLLQCDPRGTLLQCYQLPGHTIFLSRHTIEESLLLHPAILPRTDRDAVDGDAPFFQNE